MHRTTRSHAGFTLVEVLVVIALLAMVASMAIPLIRNDTPQQQMEATCQRLGSLMAMCRAQAMLNGHPVRLTWEVAPDDPKGLLLPVVTHEADPIVSPCEFKRMAASWANDPILQRDVQVRLVQLGTFDLSSLTKTQGRFDLPTDPSVQMVEFRPDGTADPAVFVLTIKLPEGSSQDELQGWVVLDAVSGLAQVKKPPTAEQFDGMLKAQAALPDLQFAEKAIEVSETDTSGTAALLGQAGLTAEDLPDILASIGAGGGEAPAGGNPSSAAGGAGADADADDATASRDGSNNNNSNNNNNTSGNTIDWGEVARLMESKDPAALEAYMKAHGGNPSGGNNNNAGGSRNGGRNNAGGGNTGGRNNNAGAGNNGGRNNNGGGRNNRGAGRSR